MDLNKIKEAAQGYERDMTAFLRAIVKNPGESCDERAHIETIAAEMRKLDFDDVVLSTHRVTLSDIWEQATESSPSTLTSTQLVSVTSTTGHLIRTRDMKQKQKSAVVEYLTSAAVSYLLYTALRS